MNKNISKFLILISLISFNLPAFGMIHRVGVTALKNVPNRAYSSSSTSQSHWTRWAHYAGAAVGLTSLGYFSKNYFTASKDSKDKSLMPTLPISDINYDYCYDSGSANTEQNIQQELEKLKKSQEGFFLKKLNKYLVRALNSILPNDIGVAESDQFSRCMNLKYTSKSLLQDFLNQSTYRLSSEANRYDCQQFLINNFEALADFPSFRDALNLILITNKALLNQEFIVFLKNKLTREFICENDNEFIKILIDCGPDNVKIRMHLLELLSNDDSMRAIWNSPMKSRILHAVKSDFTPKILSKLYGLLHADINARKNIEEDKAIAITILNQAYREQIIPETDMAEVIQYGFENIDPVNFYNPEWLMKKINNDLFNLIDRCLFNKRYKEANNEHIHIWISRLSIDDKLKLLGHYFDELMKSSIGQQIVYDLIANSDSKQFDSYFKKTAHYIMSKKDTLVNPMLFSIVFHSGDKDLQQALLHHLSQKQKKELFDVLFECQGIHSNQNRSRTQTEQHLLLCGSSNELSSSISIVRKWLFDTQLTHLANTINQEQEKLEQQGYATFVHGQRREYRPAEHWYTFLWQLKHQRVVPNFLFAHVKKIDSNEPQDQVIRQSLLKYGRNDFGKRDARDRILFMNAALFGNLNNSGSCTAHYIDANHNMGDISATIKDTFVLFGLEDMAQQFSLEFEELERLNRDLSSKGNLLLIGIPFGKLNEYVYSSTSGGPLKSITINERQTTNMQEIMKAWKENPQSIKYIDDAEFCLIMDSQIGMNPDSGIVIKDFIAADEDKLDEYNRKEAELMNRVELEYLRRYHPEKYRKMVFWRIFSDFKQSDIDRWLAILHDH